MRKTEIARQFGRQLAIRDYGEPEMFDVAVISAAINSLINALTSDMRCPDSKSSSLRYAERRKELLGAARRGFNAQAHRHGRPSLPIFTETQT